MDYFANGPLANVKRIRRTIGHICIGTLLYPKYMEHCRLIVCDQTRVPEALSISDLSHLTSRNKRRRKIYHSRQQQAHNDRMLLIGASQIDDGMLAFERSVTGNNNVKCFKVRTSYMYYHMAYIRTMETISIAPCL